VALEGAGRADDGAVVDGRRRVRRWSSGEEVEKANCGCASGYK
jgi:hypothetical protein